MSSSIVACYCDANDVQQQQHGGQDAVRTRRDESQKDNPSPLYAAIDLLLHVPFDLNKRHVSAFINKFVGNDGTGIRNVTLGGEILYNGPGTSIIAIDVVAIVDRILSVDANVNHGDCAVPRLVVNDHQMYPFIWDTWKADKETARALLARSLQGDDVAHCALQIAALVGDAFWKSFADTSISFRTGLLRPSACPPWLIDAALAGGDDLDHVGMACDAAILYDALCTLQRDATDRQTKHTDHKQHYLCLSTDSEYWCSEVGKTKRPRSRVTAAAVNVAVGFWVFCVTGVPDMPGAQLATTRQVADALARVRAMGWGARVRVFTVGQRYLIREPCLLLSHLLNGVCVAPDDRARYAALANAIAFCDQHDTKACLGTIVDVVAATAIDNLNQLTGRGADDCRRRVSGSVDIDATTETIDALDRRLYEADEAWLHDRLGGFWNDALPHQVSINVGESYLLCENIGEWRHCSGRTCSWADFVRLARTNRTSVYRNDNARTPYPYVDSRVAHKDPALAPDLAYGLCREALAGSARATDCLAILSMASPAWKMLADTVGNVVEWLANGCPFDDDRNRWTQPLVEWVLDVPPHGDLATRFDDMQDAFNTKSIESIESNGPVAMGPTVNSFQNDYDGIDGQPKPCTHNNDKVTPFYSDFPCRMCLWRDLPYVNVVKDTTINRQTTFKGALIEALVYTPIAVDGRQILATETMCHLLGTRGRGIYALIRALYTVDTLRHLVIHKAQADMVPLLTDTLL